MVRHPVVGSIGQTLWNFSSRSQAFIQPTQGLQGEVLQPGSHVWSSFLALCPDGHVCKLAPLCCSSQPN